MKTRSFGLLIALAVVLAITPAWSEDIAGNGGFETAGGGGATDSDMWSEFGPMSERDSTNPSSGSWAHRMYTQGGGSSGINQSSIGDVGLASLEENSTVTVSMDVEATYGPGGVGFAVLRILNGVGAIVADSGLQNVPAGPYQTWSLPSLTVPAYGAAPNDAYAAFVEINAVSGAFAESTSEVFVDNVTVDATLGDGGTGPQLSPYSQDFEGLLNTTVDQPAQVALANDGWKIFVNLLTPGGDIFGGYGPFPAPNGGFGGPAFCAVVVGEGGPEQGDQQLSVYSNYNDGTHGTGNFVEANVFQEWTVGAVDVGSTWNFSFDHKRGNIEGLTTALAFIKTLDPNAGFALTNFVTADMTNISDEWGSSQLSIAIDPTLENQILQIGFLSVATNFEGSGIFYDNINFSAAPAGACCTPQDCTESPVDECVGEYQGDGTTCDEADCVGPLFITLCHTPPGNFGNPRTITVGLAAAQAHLNHGDTLGACETYDPGVVLPLGSEGIDTSNPIEFQNRPGIGATPANTGRPGVKYSGKPRITETRR